MNFPTSQDLLERALMLVPMILSLSVHEFAHAWSAYKLGDDTAARMGRLTLNPLAHIDPFGTFLIPLLSPIPFGWAKPVPVNPVRFTRKISMSRGMMITAAAGPVSNVILAVVCTVIYALMLRLSSDLLSVGTEALLTKSIVLNLALALFNLLPVPPLDGSRIVDGLVPARHRAAWETFTGYSSFLLIAVMVFGGYIIAGPLGITLGWVDSLIRLITTA
ncbi:MAG TPA: site-2 protease family protein [Myxococcales bacterium]|jgi:Zn-dependent protease